MKSAKIKKVRGHLVKVKMVIFIFGCVILLTIYKYKIFIYSGGF